MKFTKFRIIYTKRNSTDYSVEFIKNINQTLNDFDFRTKVEGTTIEFERAFRSIPNVGTKRDPFKILRTGRIIVTVKSNNLIETKSIIDLSHLTFLSVSMGLAIFLFYWFWDLNLITGAIFSFIIITAVFLIGWISVSGKINRIITIAEKRT